MCEGGLVSFTHSFSPHVISFTHSLTTNNSKMSNASTLERPEDDDKKKKKAEQFTLWVKEKSKELKVSEEYFLLEFFRD